MFHSLSGFEHIQFAKTSCPYGTISLSLSYRHTIAFPDRWVHPLSRTMNDTYVDTYTNTCIYTHMHSFCSSCVIVVKYMRMYIPGYLASPFKLIALKENLKWYLYNSRCNAEYFTHIRMYVHNACVCVCVHTLYCKIFIHMYVVGKWSSHFCLRHFWKVIVCSQTICDIHSHYCSLLSSSPPAVMSWRLLSRLHNPAKYALYMQSYLVNCLIELPECHAVSTYSA